MQPHLKLLLSHGIPDICAHSIGQTKSVTKPRVKCAGKYTLPTASRARIEKERIIDCKQTIMIFHSIDDLHSLAVFSLLHALLAQWTFFIVLSTSYISQINFNLTFS